MAVNLSDTCRNNHLDNIEALLIAGGVPKMQLYTGTKPATCATGATGTLVYEMLLPADPMQTASGGLKQKSATPWTGSVTPGNAAAVGYFRLVTNAGVCVLQGTVTPTGGGGDLTLDNAVLASGQTLTITQFDLTAGNA